MRTFSFFLVVIKDSFAKWERLTTMIDIQRQNNESIGFPFFSLLIEKQTWRSSLTIRRFRQGDFEQKRVIPLWFSSRKPKIDNRCLVIMKGKRVKQLKYTCRRTQEFYDMRGIMNSLIFSPMSSKKRWRVISICRERTGLHFEFVDKRARRL
jgi:hypothetical protein